MLKLENVSKIYYTNGIVATGISKVNLELNIGEFVVITGESGSGKSTLLNVISGIDSYEEGEMYINGKETSHYTEKDFEEYRKKYIANIFQSFNLINSYTVYQNVELVLLLNGYKRRQIKKKVLDIIDKVGLTKFKNTKVSKLSGGQKQRVAIARAIVKDTPIIVADEPTGNLDTKSAYEIIELLKNVAKDKLVVIVTHNIEQVEKYATRIIKMHDGRMIQNTEIKNINEEILDIIEDLKSTLEFGTGLGIAAPQIGINKRIIVVGAKKENIKYHDAEEIPVTAMINPTWRKISNETDIQYEGCLSVPSIRGKVERYKDIELTYYDENGKQITRQLHGFFARLVQHECDHLEGIVFLERVKDKNGFATIDNINKYNLKEN